MKAYALPVLILAFAACSRGNPEEDAVSGPAPPPSAALAVRGAMTLDRSLAMIAQELSAAQDEGDLTARLVRAEAISDRLLETRLPFAWMTARAYGVESLLRQIQSLSDRILAELRSGAHPEAIDRDLKDLAAKVGDLRNSLKAGGGAMPISLDSLLAAYSADSLLKIEQAGGE